MRFLPIAGSIRVRQRLSTFRWLPVPVVFTTVAYHS